MHCNTTVFPPILSNVLQMKLAGMGNIIKFTASGRRGNSCVHSSAAAQQFQRAFSLTFVAFYILIIRLLLLPRSSISVHFIGTPILARLFKNPSLSPYLLVKPSFVLLWIFRSLLHVTPLQKHLAPNLTKQFPAKNLSFQSHDKINRKYFN